MITNCIDFVELFASKLDMAASKHQGFRSVPDWLMRRTIGSHVAVGLNRGLDRILYNSLTCVRTWNPLESCHATDNGGIFNFDFSTDG